MTVFKLFDNSAALCKWSFQKESISSHFNSDLLPTNRRRWFSFCLSLIQTYFHRRGFPILARRSIIRKDYKRMNNKNDEICARIFRRSRAGWAQSRLVVGATFTRAFTKIAVICVAYGFKSISVVSLEYCCLIWLNKNDFLNESSARVDGDGSECVICIPN